MFVTYAQNFEDLMLWRALGTIEGGFYIDVGANHPDDESVTKAFYLKGWHGINVEPDREPFEALQAARSRDVNLNIGLWSEPGRRKLYSVDGCSALSTLSEWIANEHRKAGQTLIEREIELRTLADVCQEYVGNQEIHFLKVDVEGVELEIFGGHDFSRWRPWIILSESHSSEPEADHYLSTETFLQRAGYEFVYSDGINRFYVDAPRVVTLRRAFLAPPNFYDNWVRARDLEMQERAERAEADNHRLYKLVERLTK